MLVGAAAGVRWPRRVCRPRPVSDRAAELELGREVAVVGPTGVAGLNPGYDVAGGLDRAPQRVGADAIGERLAKHAFGRGRIVGEAPEEKIAQLIAAKGPGREAIGGGGGVEDPLGIGGGRRPARGTGGGERDPPQETRAGRGPPERAGG